MRFMDILLLGLFLAVAFLGVNYLDVLFYHGAHIAALLGTR